MFKLSPYFAGAFMLVLVACQTGTKNEAHSTPLMGDIDKNKSEQIKLKYADTNSSANRLLINSLDSLYRIENIKGFNGSVLVAQSGKILYERYYGYADKVQNIPLSKETPSQLASTSKPFTATAVLWLHQNKYLDIDQPVATYLKGFPYPNITVKMLLCQRSGLPDYTKIGSSVWGKKTPMYNKDLLNYLIAKKPGTLFKSGTSFNYSNTNYALLALIIEETTGISYKQFLKELIFDPLGMKHTFVYDPADEPNYIYNLAVSYRANYTLFPNTYEDGIYGDKGIYSTVEDMYRWDQSFYKNYLLNNKIEKMSQEGYSNEKAGKKNYGLGWRTNQIEVGYPLIYHNGWWHGNNTVFNRFIKDEITIIVLGNKYNSNIYQQGNKIFEIMKQHNRVKHLKDVTSGFTVD